MAPHDRLDRPGEWACAPEILDALGRADVAMSRYADGDDAAFAILYAELHPRLLGYLERRAPDEARALDLLQQTFLQMHRARGRFARGARVSPWAFAIARRLLIDEARRSQRQLRLIEAGDPPESADPHAPTGYDLLAARQIAAQVERELAQLPEAQREAFELVRLGGLSLEEAAQITGASIPALKSRAHRAYESLRSMLQGMARN